MKTENIRLERFRKLKKEVRGSVKYLLVGIDVAKEKHIAFLARQPERHLLKDLFLTTTGKGLQSCWQKPKQ